MKATTVVIETSRHNVMQDASRPWAVAEVTYDDRGIIATVRRIERRYETLRGAIRGLNYRLRKAAEGED